MKDPSPTRIAFDLKRLVRTKYVIDSFEAHKVGAEDGVITPGSHAYVEAGGRRATGRIV